VLEQGANDLHMVQLMPLPPKWFCLSDTGLFRLSWKRGHYIGIIVVMLLTLIDADDIDKAEWLHVELCAGFLTRQHGYVGLCDDAQ